MGSLRNLYNNLKTVTAEKFPALFLLVDKNKTIIKYIISGGTAAFTDLLLLFFFTDLLGLYYLLSAALAFMVAIVISFNLQKRWTFRDTNENVGEQMTVYVIVGIVNLGLNTLLMFLFVDFFHVMYIVAQIFAGGTIAISSFLIYRFFIFKKQDKIKSVS